jgi:multiple sugar transport system permease protein
MTTVTAHAQKSEVRITGHRTTQHGWSLLLKIAAILIIAVWLFPVYWIVLTSLKPLGEINRSIPTFFFIPNLDNYWDLFSQFRFAGVLFNTLIIAIASCSIVLMIGLPAAYSLARLKTPGEKHIALWILSLRFVPPIVVGIPLYLQWQSLNLLDTQFGLIIVYVSFNLPFAIWLLRGFLSDLPFELEEAALLDGLTRTQIIRRIVIPISLPGIASTAIFTFVFTWNEYLMALLLTSVKAVTVPVTISKFVQPYTILWGDLSAAVVIQLVPMLLVVFLLQRHIVRGLTLGAVK